MKEFNMVLTRTILVITSICISCPKDDGGPDDIILDLPEARSFNMGMVPWPYAYTVEAIFNTYVTIGNHADLIAHQMDDGVPWDKALANESYHENIEEDFDFRLDQAIPGHKVYLAINPIGAISDNRTGIAEYWDSTNNMELPAGWEDKEFDDADVITAYTNHVLYMIRRFDPDYMAYGIEVNMLAENDPEAFEKYLIFVEQVYTEVKNNYPDIPLFLTIVIETYLNNLTNQKKVVQKLLPYTDYIAVSSYPYDNIENPANLPDNWFSQMHDLAPEKPFVVAETGFLAEDLILEKYNINYTGSETWQAEYVEFLLEKAHALNAEFVVWFVPRDYDEGWITMQQLGVDEMDGAWKDTGLYDGKGNARRSLTIWDAWFKLPLKNMKR